jgi:hypothetical protein
LDSDQVLQALGVRDVGSCLPLPGGHINTSLRLRGEGPLGERDYLLQRLNPAVFPDGRAVLANALHVSRHLVACVERQRWPDQDRQVLRLFPAPDGSPGWRAPDGAWWRLGLFIGGARALLLVTDPRQAREAGAAFGRWHRLLAEYRDLPLVETLPGFHDTGRRLRDLEAAAARDAAGRRGAALSELQFARARQAYAARIGALQSSGALPLRVAHNDAKLSNVLLDDRSGEGLAVIDFDTVMPGTVLADVGDLLRSAASPTGEDEPELGRIQADAQMVEAVLRGFLAEAGARLVPVELDHLVFAALWLTYEQGVRFLTDYLAGDSYYRTSRPGQNLERCRVQFALLEGLETLRPELEGLMSRTRG